MIFFSFAEATSLVSETSKLSEKSFSTNQSFNISEKNDRCSKLGNQLWAYLLLEVEHLLGFGKFRHLEIRRF